MLLDGDWVKIWLAFLNADFSYTFLPAAYFRIKLAPTDERRIFTFTMAVAVGLLALFLFGEQRGSCALGWSSGTDHEQRRRHAQGGVGFAFADGAVSVSSLLRLGVQNSVI